MNDEITRVRVGDKLQLKKGFGKLSARDVHVVNEITLAPAEAIESDGRWWIKTDKTQDEWFAISLFRPALTPKKDHS
jgi:hypothetical protein